MNFDLNPIVLAFTSLVGFPALLAACINLAKRFGWLKDGLAPVVVFWANLLSFALVAVAVFYGKTQLVGEIDSQLSAFTKVLLLLVEWIGAMGMTKAANVALIGMPGIGYRHPVG